jgi:dipeptidyl aminopeptidase/acylaminoacyl peptidase
MKRCLFIVLVIVFLSGCGKTAYLNTELVVTDTLMLDESIEVLFRQDDLGSRRMVSYIEEKEEILLSENGPSHPETSPNGMRLAFIDNAYWEAIGQVMLFDGKNGLVPFEYIIDQYTPKDLEWLDEERLLVVIGYAYGTVSLGGDLYIFDTTTQEVEMIYQAEDHEEVISSCVTDGDVKLKIARFSDDFRAYSIHEQVLEVQ